MDFDDNTDPRRDLYTRFRLSLSHPMGERYFDEDELVTVFDYAGDLADDYVRLEVLMCGARLFPDSAMLAERRAMLYLDLFDPEDENGGRVLNEYLADNSEASSPLFDIARLEADPPADGTAALDFLLGQYDSFSDEEIIRLVDLASDIDCYPWLVANLESLKKKVSYQPSLLYEVMKEAFDHHDDTTAIATAEQLIEFEPFTVAYWIALFRSQARAGLVEESRTTFEYARDLADGNTADLLSLCECVYNLAPYLFQETIELLLRLHNDEPDEYTFTDCLGAFYVQTGRPDKVVELLTDYVDRNPIDGRAISKLLLFPVPDIEILIERFYLVTGGEGFDESALDTLADHLNNIGAMVSLNALLNVAQSHRPLTVSQLVLHAQAMYALGQYDRVVAAITPELIEMLLNVRLISSCECLYMYMASLMRLGRQTEALGTFEKLRPSLENLQAGAPMGIRMVVRSVFTLVDKIRRHPDSDRLYWQYFSMLGYGKF